MSRPPRAPDLVVFDVDGTLQDTFQWWPEVIRRGVREFGRQIDVALPEPDADQAWSVVGLKDEQVWAPFLPPEHQERWRELRRLVVPMEVALLRDGRDFLFPGTRAMLGELRQRGARLALASNCRASYFDAVLDGQGLRPLVDWAFCLDSPGVATKRDMVALALAAAGTRHAVVIGDRAVDEDAAHAHGLPFVLRAGRRTHAEQLVAPRARFATSGELPDLLAQRGTLVQDLAERLRSEQAHRGGSLRVGITGPVASGKTVLTAELARELDAPRRVALDDFLRPAGSRPPVVNDHLHDVFDVDRAVAAVAGAGGGDAMVLVDGVFLLRDPLRSRLDVVIHVHADDDEILRRVAGRGREPVAVARDHWLSAHRGYLAAHPPRRHGAWWLDNSNLVTPSLVDAPA